MLLFPLEVAVGSVSALSIHPSQYRYVFPSKGPRCRLHCDHRAFGSLLQMGATSQGLLPAASISGLEIATWRSDMTGSMSWVNLM